MTSFHKVMATAVSLTFGVLFSTGAFAVESEMTCAEFNALDADGQTAEITRMLKAESTVGEGGEPEMPGNNYELIAPFIDHCKGGDDLKVRDGNPFPEADRKGK